MKLKLLLALMAILFSSAAAHAVDLAKVEHDLTTTGVVGWIHGSVESQGIYVFTYRDPSNFFDYIEMSLVAYKPEIKKQLASFGRHDQVRVKGFFLDNPSPQKHIKITSIELVKKYQPGYDSAPYEHAAKIPDELENKSTALFLVHAIGGDGHILVVEYRDVVMPIYVKNADLTKGLYRGDVVQLNFVIQDQPERPVHLNLDDRAPQPVKVVDPIHSKHGQPAAVEGALILFPKSPEIAFNVFAVQEELPEGLKRQYTLVNFDDPAAFAKIREALQKAWDKYPGAYVNGRNKLVSTRIRVRATGVFNDIDPGQANPQILLKSVDSLQILEK